MCRIRCSYSDVDSGFAECSDLCGSYFTTATPQSDQRSENHSGSAGLKRTLAANDKLAQKTQYGTANDDRTKVFRIVFGQLNAARVLCGARNEPQLTSHAPRYGGSATIHVHTTLYRAVVYNAISSACVFAIGRSTWFTELANRSTHRVQFGSFVVFTQPKRSPYKQALFFVVFMFVAIIFISDLACAKKGFKAA